MTTPVRRLAPTLGALLLAALVAAASASAAQPPTTVPAPSPAPSGGALTAITVGSAHACGLDADGAAWCWGSDRSGQLGAGEDRGDAPAAVRVAGGHAFRAISAGAAHTCGVTRDRRVLCWGRHASGELGRAAGADACDGVPCSRTPVEVHPRVRADTVAAGHEHACALDRGVAFCWGRNDEGQLGRDTGDESCAGVPCGATPGPVAGAPRLSAITAGGAHACGLAGGGAWCWGSNASGQLGAGLWAPRVAHAVPVASRERFASVDAGGVHTCARGADGRAWCWGSGEAGRLGSGATEDAATPVRVAGAARFAAVAAGGTHTCGVTRDGAALCWGSDHDGRLAGAARERCAGVPCSPAPVAVGSAPVAQVSAGGAFTCARAAAEVRCWGTGWGIPAAGTVAAGTLPGARTAPRGRERTETTEGADRSRARGASPARGADPLLPM